MVGIMAESSSYVGREFHGKCFDRTQFIVGTVKALKIFLHSLSEKSPTIDVIKVMLTSQVSHFSKSVFVFRVLLYHRLCKPNIKRKYPETNTTENKFTKLLMDPRIHVLVKWQLKIIFRKI